MTEYDASFMDYTSDASRVAADVIAAHLSRLIAPTSVLDVGCARGVWLAAWQRAGVRDIAGVDGEYVDRTRLHILSSAFSAVDLAHPFRLGREFDLVQSLEVAEHLEPECAESFVASIVAHARTFVLFSAAVPGQGGERHRNERALEYWREVFRRHGFIPADVIRERIQLNREIPPWYRFNTLLYVRAADSHIISAQVRAALVPPGTPLHDFSTPLYRIRKFALRRIPGPLVTLLARIKARLWR